MDTNPPEGQQNQQTPQNQDPVVFSSTAIASTKSRSSAQYFTKVQKATPWQKFSEWFARKRNASQAALDAKQAEFKANRAAKKRAAELAAYNIPMPNGLNNQPAQPQTQPTAPAQPIAAQSASTQPTPADPSQPAAINTFTEVELPVDTTPTDSPTKSKKPIISGIVIILVLCLTGVIALPIFQPWNQDNRTPEEVEVDTIIDNNKDAGANEIGVVIDPETNKVTDINIETAARGAAPRYVSDVLESVMDVTYNAYDEEGALNANIVAANIDAVVQEKGIKDKEKLKLFDLEKARQYMSNGDYEAGVAILDKYNEDELYACQAELYLDAYYAYYERIGDDNRAKHYFEKINELPTISEGGTNL